MGEISGELKLDRAGEHLEAFKREANVWMKVNFLADLFRQGVPSP